MDNNQRPHGPWRIDPEVLEAALEAEFSRHSILTPVLKHWEEDLPGNNEEQQTAPRLTWVNDINDTWMEVPRYENILWWGGWVGAVMLVIPLLMIFTSFFQSFVLLDGILFFMVLIGFFVIFSLFILNLKMVLFVPRGTPVRFNRKRQKVYVYEYRWKWNPWVTWPTTIKVFDWADIRAQMSREIDRYDQGYRLYCAVCKPGTNDVIDRFVLSWTVGHPKLLRGLWSHCCHYMQKKPVPTRPLYRERPRSWCPLKNNVHWPEAIDRESTTAPESITNGNDPYRD